MAEIVVELPDGDVTPLLPHLDTAAFVNLHPGVDAQEVPPSGPFGGLFGNRGPVVPAGAVTILRHDLASAQSNPSPRGS